MQWPDYGRLLKNKVDLWRDESTQKSLFSCLQSTRLTYERDRVCAFLVPVFDRKSKNVCGTCQIKSLWLSESDAN